MMKNQRIFDTAMIFGYVLVIATIIMILTGKAN